MVGTSYLVRYKSCFARAHFVVRSIIFHVCAMCKRIFVNTCVVSLKTAHTQKYKVHTKSTPLRKHTLAKKCGPRTAGCSGNNLINLRISSVHCIKAIALIWIIQLDYGSLKLTNASKYKVYVMMSIVLGTHTDLIVS